ncbi:MAG: hypothetical protein PHP04_06195 [Bacteroidales bacterium]|nr:hypothetical protein [Bacteroidales bacterium]HNW73620.1 hypothetical protein [Bacteroidales bacterium]HPS50191.1 hypothetical protein [Bacteroidales bacterium]
MNRYLILLLIVLTSCNTFFKNKTEQVLARVHDDYLYESDIRGIVAAGTPREDSITIVNNFIRNWVRHRLIIHQAEKNLTNEQMDFSKQLETYKNSLIIYTYEHELVRQKLDTLVTEEEIEQYYDANQQNFLLKDNIVQVQYVKLPVTTSQVRQFKKLLNSDEPDDHYKLSDLCEKNALDYYLDDQNWLLFRDFLGQIPLNSYNQEDFLKNHKYVEYQDSLFLYLIRFKDFKIKESVSPLGFERKRIIDIILNKRKMELLNRMEEDIYQSALKNKSFEIF